MSELAKKARERAIDAFTEAAFRAATARHNGTTAEALERHNAVRKLIAEGCDELLLAALEANRVEEAAK